MHILVQLIGAFREEHARFYFAQSRHVSDPAGRPAKNMMDAESLRSCNTLGQSLIIYLASSSSRAMYSSIYEKTYCDRVTNLCDKTFGWCRHSVGKEEAKLGEPLDFNSATAAPA